MFDREKELFDELNRELKKKNIDLTVICVGGFVLSHYGFRTTHDIDGFFNASKEVVKIIKTVGDKFGINSQDELWLNNSVQNLNDPPAEGVCDILYEYSNLTILIPPLDYIIGMKLTSAREIDIKDASEIIRKQNIVSPKDLVSKLSDYGFGYIDESLILEVFGEAYGMEWLEKYYTDNEFELRGINNDC